MRGTLPNSANTIASRRLDLPAPVGPVMTNRSKSFSTMLCRSRKAVKPWSSSFSGRTADLLKELVENADQVLSRFGAVVIAVVPLEQFRGAHSPEIGYVPVGILALVHQSNLHCVR